MNGRIILIGLLVLALLAGAVGVGVYAYNAGVAQGLVDSGKLVMPAPGAVPPVIGAVPYGYGYGWGWHRPFGFGFGCLGLIFPLLFFFLIFGFLRRAFWGGGRHHGPWGGNPSTAFDEWHRRAHGEQPRTPEATPAKE